MISSREIFAGLILPAAISAAILIPTLLPALRRRPHWQALLLVLSLAVAFMISFAILFHRPPFPPLPSDEWIFYFPIPVALIALLAAAWPRFPRTLISILALLIFLSCFYLLLRPLLQSISFPEFAEHLSILTLASFLSYLSLNQLALRGRDNAVHFLLILIIAATAPIIMMSATITLGQTVLILTTALAASFPFAWRLSIPISGAPLLLVLLLWHTLIIGAYYFASLTMENAFLLVLSPHAAWLAETPRVQQWPKVPRIVLRYTAPLLPMLLAQTLALLRVLDEGRQSNF